MHTRRMTVADGLENRGEHFVSGAKAVDHAPFPSHDFPFGMDVRVGSKGLRLGGDHYQGS